MAKLSPIPRDEANAGIAACSADPGHFNISHGNWHACCTEGADGKATCIVCTDDENCSRYEESQLPDFLKIMRVSGGLRLAPVTRGDSDGRAGDPARKDLVGKMVSAHHSSPAS